MFVLLLWCATCCALSTNNVNNFIGTGGNGYGIGATPPGAQVPFGLVRLAPDTAESFDIVLPWRHTGGYYYADTVVRGFTHVHTQGAGIDDLGVIGVMPFTQPISASSLNVAGEGFRSSFDKASETARPGFYSCALDAGVDVQLTATQLVGRHRYTYRAGGADRSLLFLPSMIIQSSKHHKGVNVTLDPVAGVAYGHLVVAESLSSRRANGLPVYFYAKFATPTCVASHGVWLNEHLKTGVAHQQGSSGDNVGGYFTLCASSPATIQLNVALSMIDVATAKRNLERQVGSKSFSAVQAEAEALWSEKLARIGVTTQANSEYWTDRTKVLTTALYHAFSAPTNYTETDINPAFGLYLGMDQKPHRIERGQAFLSDLSIWDIYRTQTPLLSVVAPEIAAQLIRSLLLMYEQGAAVPRWALATIYASCMVGNHANVIIADAFFRGVRGFNTTQAFEAMYSSVRNPNQPHAARNAKLLKSWLNDGYLPLSLGSRTAAQALDWALDDGVTSNFGAALGFHAQATELAKTAQNYRNHWHKKLFCPRQGNTWHCPSEVESYNPFDSHYIEDNAQVYSYYVLHDVPGLVQLNGGNQSFAQRLQEFAECTMYETATFLPNPCIWIGNEPSLAIPWLGNYVGRADITQKYTHEIAKTFFANRPDGIPGNDDYGATSSWLVWASLGLFPAVGTDQYIIGAPMFPSVTIRIPQHNQTLEIKTVHFDRSESQVVRCVINGVDVDLKNNAFVTHKQLFAKPTNKVEFWFK